MMFGWLRRKKIDEQWEEKTGWWKTHFCSVMAKGLAFSLVARIGEGRGMVEAVGDAVRNSASKWGIEDVKSIEDGLYLLSKCMSEGYIARSSFDREEIVELWNSLIESYGFEEDLKIKY